MGWFGRKSAAAAPQPMLPVWAGAGEREALPFSFNGLEVSIAESGQRARFLNVDLRSDPLNAILAALREHGLIASA